MKRAALILSFAAILTAAAAPVRTATEGFVTNKIAEAVAAIPAPDYSTDNTELVETIEATAPAPGDYANVSNKAVNAVGVDKMPTIEGYAFTNWNNNIKITNTDGYLCIDTNIAIRGGLSGGGPSERVRLFAGWNLDLSDTFWDTLWEELEGSETDPTVPQWAKAQTKPTYTASEVGATTPEDVTAAIREQSLGGIWDETLQVWWTPRMRNGSLTYEATTNVNLNAEN